MREVLYYKDRDTVYCAVDAGKIVPSERGVLLLLGYRLSQANQEKGGIVNMVQVKKPFLPKQVMDHHCYRYQQRSCISILLVVLFPQVGIVIKTFKIIHYDIGG